MRSANILLLGVVVFLLGVCGANSNSVPGFRTNILSPTFDHAASAANKDIHRQVDTRFVRSTGSIGANGGYDRKRKLVSVSFLKKFNPIQAFKALKAKGAAKAAERAKQENLFKLGGKNDDALYLKFVDWRKEEISDASARSGLKAQGVSQLEIEKIMDKFDFWTRIINAGARAP